MYGSGRRSLKKGLRPTATPFGAGLIPEEGRRGCARPSSSGEAIRSRLNWGDRTFVQIGALCSEKSFAGGHLRLPSARVR